MPMYLAPALTSAKFFRQRACMMHPTLLPVAYVLYGDIGARAVNYVQLSSRRSGH